MKLLILTQAVDQNDPVLGFFHGWIEALAQKFEQVTVICLKKGEYQLPKNVRVLSLGKEEGKSRLTYVSRFYLYVWRERKNYDAVFVHMNQEYVILGWKLWWLIHKPIYLWRNHAKGNLLTRFAVMVSKKVFYTSPQSFTAQYRKAVRMPVGVDSEVFKPDPSVLRQPGSILFLGRIAPVKRVLEFVDWLRGHDFQSATIAGNVGAGDEAYEHKVRERVLESGLREKVSFLGSVTQEEAKKLYQSHEIYANFTPPGSFDKTIFEAAACGAELMTKNHEAEKSAREEDNSLTALVEKLDKELSYEK